MSEDEQNADILLETLERLDTGHSSEKYQELEGEGGTRGMSRSISAAEEIQLVHRVQHKVVVHRLEFLWFSIKVTVLMLPLIFLWWLCVTTFYNDLQDYGVSPSEANSRTGATLPEGDQGLLEAGIGFLVLTFVANSIQWLALLIGFCIVFGDRLDAKQVFRENWGWMILLFLVVGMFQMQQHWPAIYYWGSQAWVANVALVIRFLGSWIGPYCVGKIIIKYLDLPWLPVYLFKYQYGIIFTANTYIAFSSFLFFAAKGDFEKGMIRLFLHGPLVEFAYACNRLLAAKLSYQENVKHTQILNLGLQFGIAVYSRLLVNNLETVESQILLSVFVSIFETTTRVNARDVDYYGQVGWINFMSCFRKGETEERKKERAKCAQHFRVNVSNDPDTYDYYRVFGEVCELIAIIFSGIVSILLRLSPGSSPLPWEQKMTSTIIQLIIEWLVELASTFAVISLGVRIHRSAEEKPIKKQQQPKKDKIESRAVGWTAEEERGGFRNWIHRRMAKSFRTHARLMEAWENPPPYFIAYLILSAWWFGVILFVGFVFLSFCHGEDDQGMFLIPCARIQEL